MMEADSILAELEERLRGRANIEPTSEFRNRVMGTVMMELARPVRRQAARGGWWAAVAAGGLVVMNVSMMKGSRDAFAVGPNFAGHDQVAREIQMIGRLEMNGDRLAK
jgi:hypothetical protein